MKVLVAGSEGSLMQAVIGYLLEMGHEVRGVDNFFRHGRIDRARAYEFIQGDLCERTVVERALQGVEVVFQSAARIFGVKGFHKFGADILSYDVQLHSNILHEAVRKGVKKIVYTSSSIVYERCSRVPSTEEELENSPIPLTDYALSKLVCERLCRAFAAEYDLDYTIWRPFNIITPYEKAEEEAGYSHVFADFIRKIIFDQQDPLEVLGDGEQVRCFTWIGDVAKSISAFSFEPSSSRQAFNLGNPEPVTMTDLASLIFKKAQESGLIPKSRRLTFRHLPVFSDDVRVRIPSIKKAEDAFGFRPTLSLSQSLDRCLADVHNVYTKG